MGAHRHAVCSLIMPRSCFAPTLSLCYSFHMFMSLAIFSPFILLEKETYGGFCLIGATGNGACYSCLCPEPLFSGVTYNLRFLMGPFEFHARLVSQSAFSLDECYPNGCLSVYSDIFCTIFSLCDGCSLFVSMSSHDGCSVWVLVPPCTLFCSVLLFSALFCFLFSV